MKERCCNPRIKCYPNYGGRGIYVTPEWLSFSGFLADMGEPDDPTLTLERIDVDAGYCKENCRWATWAEQAINRRTNINYTINGETLCLAEWCRVRGSQYNRTYRRIHRLGWPIERALA